MCWAVGVLMTWSTLLIASVSPPSGLVAWWPGDGNAADIIGAHHGLLQNGATFATGFVGEAFLLKAASDASVRVPDNPALDPTNITISAWVKPSSYPTAGCVVVRKQGGDTTMQYLLQLGDGATAGVPHFNCGITAYQPVGPTPLPLNQWSHIVGTYDGQQARVYVNGAIVDARPMTGPMPVTTHDLFIGRVESNTSRDFDGLIDELAIWDRGLDSNEVAAIYAAGNAGMTKPVGPACTPPPANLVAWWPGEDSAQDLMSTNHGTLGSDVSFVPGKVGRAFQFVDSTNSYIALPNSPAFAASSNRLTIAAWVKPDFSVTGSGKLDTILSKRDGCGTYSYHFCISRGVAGVGPTGCLYFGIWGTPQGSYSSTRLIPKDGQFHYVAVTFDGAKPAANIQFYIDGDLAGAVDVQATIPLTSAGPMIGRHGGCDAYSTGAMDEIMFFDRELAPREILALYYADSAGACRSVTYSPTSGFDVTPGNPNGVWSYGWMPADFSQFQLYTNSGHGYGGSPYWNRDAGDPPPIIWKNITGDTPYGVPPGWLALHPGPGTEPSVLRWTAPAAGIAHVAGSFLAGDGGFMQVAVRRNNQAWWQAGDAGAFDLTTAMGVGGTLDFAVYGGYIGGNTPLAVNLTLNVGDSLAPSITLQPSNQVVNASTNVELKAWADGSPPLAWQWFFNGTPLAGATNATLVLTNVQPAQSGAYRAVVSNGVDSATSQEALLDVHSVPGDWTLNTLPSGLISWWNAEGNANDVAGRNPGALEGGVTFEPGLFGQAFRLHGRPDSVVVPDSSSLALSNQFTIEAWINLTTTVNDPVGPPGRGLISKVGGAGGNNGYQLGFGLEPSKSSFGINFNSLGQAWNYANAVSYTFSPALPMGVWMHVAATYDDNALMIYFNGRAMATNVVGAHMVANTGSRLRIGGDDNGNVYFDGLVDDARLYGRALAPEEIFHLFAGGRTRPIITREPSSQVVTATRDVSLSAEGSGTAPLFYQWYFTNTPLANTTNAILTLPLITTNQAGPYFVVVTNLIGAATSQVAVITVLPDTDGPVVTNFVPVGWVNTNVGRLLIQFDERINTNSFTVDDITVRSPTGALNPAAFTLVPGAPFDGRSFEVRIPDQSREGDYSVTIGPVVTDLSGNPMALGRLAVFTIDKTGPRVAGLTPTLVSNAISFVEVTFDSAIAGNSFTTAAVKLAGTGAPSITGVEILATNVVRIHFAAPLPAGAFTLTIGPAITDLAGNPMLQAFVGTITVILPDLAVAQITAPASALAGQPLYVSWTVTNLGPGVVAGSWKSSVALATNAAGSDAQPLGAFSVTNTIPAAGSLAQTGLVILPAGIAGNRWLVVTADADNEIGESVETNNSRVAAAPLLIRAPDLEVSRLVSPATARFGQTINVAFVVTNRGTATALASWSDRVYLSSVSNSLAGAIPLLTVNVGTDSPLAARTSYSRAEAVTLPFDAESVPGTYFIIVVADYAGAQPESDAANNQRGTPITLALPPLPDLAVSLLSAPVSGIPGQPMVLSWEVTNPGSIQAEAPWSESIFVSNSVAGLRSLTLMDFTNALPAGGFVIRTQTVTLPIDGPAGDLRFAVEIDSRHEVIESNETNNLALATNSTTVPLTLTLELPVTQIAENAAQPILACTLTRNGDHSQPLSVSIASSDTTQIAAPASVTIAAGQASAAFSVQVKHDGIVRGPQVVTIALSANGYPGARQNITVLDADFPHLILTLATNQVWEGRTIAATLTSDWISTNPLPVTLESSDTNRLLAPADMVIPAGTNRVQFALLAVDDNLIEAPASFTVQASAAGFISSQASVTIIDNDLPLVMVSLAQHMVGKSAGPQATLGTVTLSPVPTHAVIIELTNSDPASIQVPARVTIPAYQAGANFDVGAIANAQVEGSRTVTIGGYVLASGLNTRVAVITPDTLTVTDDHGPSLRLAIDNKLVRGGLNPATTATVSRNTPSTNALSVALASSDPTEATVPSTVVIPVGQASATFHIASPAHGAGNGNQPVTITASASGFAPAADTMTVTDADLPDLFVAGITVPASADTEAYVTVSYRVANQGFAPTTTNFNTRVFLSSDAVVGNDTLVGQYRFNGSLPSGQYFEQSLQVRLPLTAGNYWVIVQADADNALTEALKNNNTGISHTPIRVGAAYGAWVRSSVQTALAGTPVPMSGRATNNLGAGVPFQLVNIHVSVRGTDRIFSALTDADGHFSATFQPLANEAGSYQIFATHPGVATGAAQDAFTLLGMKATAASVSLTVIEGSSATNVVSVENLSEVALQALQATVVQQPPELGVTLTLGNHTLPGSGSAALNCRVTAPAGAAGGAVQVHLATAEGPAADVYFSVEVESLRPRLVADSGELVAGMARGKQVVLEFGVANQGGMPTGPVTISLPATPWLQVASTNPIPSLAPGESNRVALVLTPPADLPLGPYTGSLALNGAGTSLSVPFNFRALSESKGDLRVEAEDEFTYFAEGAPRVAGANVAVRDAVSNLVVTNGLTQSNGLFFAAQLPEGYYVVEVTATNHDAFRATRLFLAGQTNTLSAFLRRQSVQYVWSVVPTEIEDQTKIVLETVFETFVPAPVVTIEPASIDLSEMQSDMTQVDLKITNHGLIAAESVQLSMPTDSDWRFTPLITDVGTLVARSSLTIPMTIERLHTANGLARVKAQSVSSDDCLKWGSANYRYRCATLIDVSLPVGLLNLRSDCGSSGTMRFPTLGFTGDSVTPGAGHGGSGTASYPVFGPPNFVVSPQTCHECMKVFMPVLIDCPPDISLSSDAGWYLIFKLVCEGESSPGFTRADLMNDVYDHFKSICPPTNGVVVPPPIKCYTRALKCPSWAQGGSTGGGGSGGIGGNKPGRLSSASVSRSNSSPPSPARSKAASLSDILSDDLPSESFVSLLPPALVRDVPLTLTVAQRFDRVMTEINVMRATFGDEAWIAANDGTNFFGWATNLVACLAPDSDQGERISAAEHQRLLSLPLPEGVTPAQVDTLVGRCNRTADYNAAGIFEAAEVPAGQSTDFISRTVLSNALVAVDQAVQASRAEGFSNILDSANAAYRELYQQIATSSGGGGGVCAEVRLRLEQEAVITRDAFKATLEVVNHSDSTLQNVSVEVVARLANGQTSTSLFGIRQPALTDLTAVDGTGVINAHATGSATWILIPSQDAAPDAPAEHIISGTLRYTQDGLIVTVPLAGVSITVYPSPRLFVKYFHQRDVYSDDPFTDVIEPAIPFSLAVMLENRGQGDARNVRITSAQPQIIDNEKGLLVDFKIIATEVAGQNLSPSLTANFGTITHGQIAIGRWLLTSSLQGLFTEYNATFEHLDDLGNNRLSLIEEVTIHEMIHLVQAGGAFEDGKPDFLANDIPDARDLPDTLYLSDGSTNPVSVVETATVDAPPSAQHLRVQLTAPMPPGWTYLRVAEPSGGRLSLQRVVRTSDGTEIALGTNAWTTDRTFVGMGRHPVKEDILHLLDFNSPGGYTLYYAEPPASDTQAPVSSVGALPAASPILFPVQWTGQDQGGSGIASYDIYVSANSSPFIPWLQSTRLTSAMYQGQFGVRYAFYSLATDQAGNREAAHATPDALTMVALSNQPPAFVAMPDPVINEGDTLQVTLAATDPDGPASALTYQLGTGAPLNAYLNPGSGLLTWPTSEADGPGTNVFAIIATDQGVPPLSATGLVRVLVREVNSAPVLAAIPDYTIDELVPLTFTNSAQDFDIPANTLRYTLGAGAPTGAGIDPVSGVFSWTPTEFQGPSTNRLAVIVTDNGVPPLSATRQFNVVVRDTSPDFTLSLGSTNLLTGESNTVAVFLNSGLDLTNLTFELEAPAARLTALSLRAGSPEVLSSLISPLASNRSEVSFVLDPAQRLAGQRVLAWLGFLAVSNQSSAIALLRPSAVMGLRSGGDPVTNSAAYLGQVVIVGNEPVLLANRSASITLFGRPGRFYVVQYKSNLSSLAPWQEFAQFQLPDQLQVITGVNTSGQTAFYRAYESQNGWARLSEVGHSGPVYSFLLQGKAGNQYLIQSATNLGGQTIWMPAYDFMLTNSTQLFDWTNHGEPLRLFRGKEQ